MKNYFQKSIKKLILSGIDRYDDNVKKNSNKESAKPKGKNRGRTIRTSMIDFTPKSQFKFKDRVIAANILSAAYDDKIERREWNLSIIIFYKNEIL
jgi:hypothetical protein